MDEQRKYGILINSDTKLHRSYFREMVKLIGVHVLYRAPYPGKHYTTYGEIDSCYNPPILTGCIFDEHPNLQTLKKIGWVSELQESASLISVDYDLPNLLLGSLFIIPSAIDNSKARLFRVTKLFTSMIYPASVTCEIVPEYEDTVVPETTYDYSHSSFNVISEEEDNLYI